MQPQIQGIIARVQDGFSAVGREIDGVAKAATSNLAHCDRVIDELGHLAKGVDLSSTDLKSADDRVARLLELSEGLIALIADSGVETSDAPLIRVVIDTAKQISDAFESAIARGEISIDQLMDENYREIPGTNPKQYLTDYVDFTDRILPGLQDPIQKSDPRIVFCVAWAKGGYLPTHNPNYRLRRDRTRSGTTRTAATGGCSTIARSRKWRRIPNRSCCRPTGATWAAVILS